MPAAERKKKITKMTTYYALASKATAALHESCGDNGLLDTRIINELLMMGANINAFDANGYTPLMIAAKAGSADKVDYLLSCGACPRVSRPHDGITAMALAADHGHAHIARDLMRAVTYLRRQFDDAAEKLHTAATEMRVASRRPTVQLRIVR